jgi:hypothetical protein
MQPRTSWWHGIVRGMQAPAMLAGCVLGGIAAPPPDDNRVAEPLPEGGAGNRPAVGFLSRCQKMLDLQIAVYGDTKDLHQVIQGTPGKRPRPEDRRASLKLAREEKAVVVEAAKAIDVLGAGEAALALPEALRELRKDAERVEGRLEVGDVGTDTQAIEQDIIDALKETIEALKEP